MILIINSKTPRSTSGLVSRFISGLLISLRAGASILFLLCSISGPDNVDLPVRVCDAYVQGSPLLLSYRWRPAGRPSKRRCCALKAGAKGYLVKGTARCQIRESVRRVAKEERFVPPEIESKLAKSMGHRQLSKRENQVLQCLSLGRTNKEIGQALSIGEGTIKHHVKSILRKLNATGRAQAIGIAIRRGVLHVG